MPRNPRRYDLERKYDSKPEVKERRAARNRARRAYEKEHGELPSSVDVNHKKPLVKGGAPTNMSNLEAKPASKNRSFARTKRAGMK
ncbi:MAG: hypothetical protein WCZ20_05350 [Hydrogenophaga sp.]